MSETKPLRGVLRSIGAVLAGVVAAIVLSLGTDVVLHATGIIHRGSSRFQRGLQHEN